MAARTLAVHFPNGETEFWFTDAVYRAGDTVSYGDRDWIVTSVQPPARGDDHASMNVREADVSAHTQDVSENPSR